MLQASFITKDQFNATDLESGLLSLGCVNFERDIVDTLCHASRGSDTTGPNTVGFLL